MGGTAAPGGGETLGPHKCSPAQTITAWGQWWADGVGPGHLAVGEVRAVCLSRQAGTRSVFGQTQVRESLLFTDVDLRQMLKLLTQK